MELEQKNRIFKNERKRKKLLGGTLEDNEWFEKKLLENIKNYLTTRKLYDIMLM